MKNLLTIITLSSLLAGIYTTSMANEVIVFPAKGQSNEQIEQDKFSCYGWAKGQSGFDPMAAPTTSSAPPAQTKQSGGTVRGGLRGAALGAVIGDSSKAAKRGAVAGGLIGGTRQASANNASAQKTEQWKQQEANKYANNRNTYNRAYSACLEGKGYTVK